jgi:hypothetical protein
MMAPLVWAGGSPIPLIICIPALSSLLLKFFCSALLDPVQGLKILVDLPEKTTPETAPLLLNPTDSELFSSLLKKCRVMRENGKLVLRYKRRVQIYDSWNQTFEINGKKYRPTQLKVLSVAEPT